MNIALPLGMALLAFGLVIRRSEGNWISPAPFWTLLWASYLILCALMFPSLNSLATGGLYIVAGSVAFAAGSLLGYRDRTEIARLTPAELRARLPGLPLMVVIALAGTVLNLSILFGRFGYSLSDLFSLPAVIAVVIGARSQNYAGMSEITRVEWGCIVLVYIGALAAGALFRLRASRAEAVLGLLGLFAASIVLGMSGSRMGALYGGAFWVAAYLTTACATAPTLRSLERSALAGSLATAGLGVLGVSILVMVIRYATNFNAVGWRVLFADAFGFGGAFGIWLDDRGFVAADLTAGARSLTRLVGIVGLREAALPTIPVDFTASNIYTLLRDLIEDFGTPGSLLVLVLVGWVVRRSFERSRQGSLAAMALLVAGFVFILTSFAVGVFFYTATTLALFVAMAYLVWAAQRDLKRQHQIAPSPYPRETARLS